MLTQVQILSASRLSLNNLQQLKDSKWAGCYFCLTIFEASMVTDFTCSTDTSGICPYCFIDSVLGDMISFKINQENLLQLKQYWFSGSLQQEK
jgi:hypothetical protein